MSVDGGQVTDLKSAGLRTPRVRPARLEDYEGIQRLRSQESWVVESPDDWRGFWLDNPLWRRLGKDWPIGWVLETENGELAGSITNIPTLYRFQGHDLICGNARGWVASEPYRGYALWLIDEYFNQPGADVCVSTSAGPMATPVVDQLATRFPLGNWETRSFWLARHVALAQRKLQRARVPLAALLAYPAAGAVWLKDAVGRKPLPRAPRDVTIEAVDRFDARFDKFWDELVRQNPEKLLAERNSRTLAWHFGIPMRAGRLWILAAFRARRLRAYCTFMRSRSGEFVRLIDYQTIEPHVDVLPGLLRAALRRCATEGVNSLENVGRGVPKMKAFDDCAPYRRKLESWRSFYRASDPSLDTKLRSPLVWDPSVYDGDTSLA